MGRLQEKDEFGLCSRKIHLGVTGCCWRKMYLGLQKGDFRAVEGASRAGKVLQKKAVFGQRVGY